MSESLVRIGTDCYWIPFLVILLCASLEIMFDEHCMLKFCCAALVVIIVYLWAVIISSQSGESVSKDTKSIEVTESSEIEHVNDLMLEEKIMN